MPGWRCSIIASSSGLDLRLWLEYRMKHLRELELRQCDPDSTCGEARGTCESWARSEENQRTAP